MSTALALRVGLVVGGWAITGALVYGVARTKRDLAPWVLLAIALPTLALPLLVPAAQPILRFTLACMTALHVFKLHDLTYPRAPVPDARRFLWFMSHPACSVLRRADLEPSPSVRENAKRIASGALQALVGGAALWLTFQLGLGRRSFVLEHVAKLLTGYVMVLGSSRLLTALLRLTLGKARDAFQNIFTAASPAEFWRRYNRIIGHYFEHDVFRRVGGLRAPVRATLIVFVASAVLHEYVFGIVLEKVQGYQTAFFLLQGIGVAATLRVRPQGAKKWAWTAATWVFNLATGVLFLASVQQVLPWWESPPFHP